MQPITVALDEEETLLAGLLFITDAIADVAHKLKPEHFYASPHRLIYEACLKLFRDSRPTDLVGVARMLEDSGNLQAVGGRSALIQFLDRCVLSHQIDFSADVIIEKHQRREAIRMAQAAIEIASSCSDWGKGRSEIEGMFYSLTQEESRNSLQSFADLSVQELETLEERAGSGAPPGVPTGFYDLDAYLGGLRPGLHLIAGRASMGKTTFACGIARNIVGRNLPVVVFSLEMSGQQIYERLLSAESSHSLGTLSRAGGDMPAGRQEQFWNEIGASMSKLSDLPGYIDSSEIVTLTHILSVSRRVKAMHGGKLGAIVIDYLQLMEPDGGDSGNRVQDLSKLTRRLKLMSGEKVLNCPIIVLSQLSRETEQGTNKRPQLHHLRESGSQEQDADSVMGIYREEYYNPETPDRGIAEILVLKNRNGPRNVIAKLLYQPEYNQFKNLKTYD